MSLEHVVQQHFIIRQLPGQLAVVRLDPGAGVPAWAWHGSIAAVVRTSAELTVVCDETVVPEDADAEKGWAALMLDGPLPFSMTGVLASVLTPLATEMISVFVLSTFETDCVLVKVDLVERALHVLEREGHFVRGAEKVRRQ